MLIAEKANRVVRIVDEKKEEYIGMGYTIKDTDGNIIKAPNDPKERIAELEAELKKVTEQLESVSGARMELLETTRSENESLKAENADLKSKLDEAALHAETADKRIAELEAELKKAETADAPKKEPKTKQAEK